MVQMKIMMILKILKYLPTEKLLCFIHRSVNYKDYSEYVERKIPVDTCWIKTEP
jgi:hypothetical protein